MRIEYCEQLSSEWFQGHVGNASGSHAASLFDFTQKGAEGAKRKLYRMLKVAELITGIAVSDNYVSPEMKWGIETEDQARRAYEIEEGVMVEQVGYVVADNPRLMCSPDGLVGDKGIVGFKCPKTTTHLSWILDKKIPEDHLFQARFELLVCDDRQWFDFATFDPRIGGIHKPKRLMVVRLHREDAAIEEMRAAAEMFIEDVDKTLRKLDDIAPPLERDDRDEVDLRADPMDPTLGIMDEDIEALEREYRQRAN